MVAGNNHSHIENGGIVISDVDVLVAWPFLLLDEVVQGFSHGV